MRVSTASVSVWAMLALYVSQTNDYRGQLVTVKHKSNKYVIIRTEIDSYTQPHTATRGQNTDTHTHTHTRMKTEVWS